MADLALAEIFGDNVIFDPGTRNITFNLDDLGYEQFDTTILEGLQSRFKSLCNQGLRKAVFQNMRDCYQ